MKNNIQDERVLSERRKIQSRGYAWIVMILLVSIVVQQFFMQAPFAQYAVEFFILIGCGLYNVICNYQKGIDIWNPQGDGKKQILLRTVISGVLSVALFAVLSGNFQIDNLAIYFISFVAFFFITRIIMIELNRKKQKSIDATLNDDDTDDTIE